MTGVFDGRNVPAFPAHVSTPPKVDIVDLSSGSDEESSCSEGLQNRRCGNAMDFRKRSRSRFAVDEEKNEQFKKPKEENIDDWLPEGFLDPLPKEPEESDRPSNVEVSSATKACKSSEQILPKTPGEHIRPKAPNEQILLKVSSEQILPKTPGEQILPKTSGEQIFSKTPEDGCKQFWKAGEYDGHHASAKVSPGGMNHVRVHPKFLHSNATSHKWVLGALAELLDNALDEVANQATFVKVDVSKNPKDGGPMLVIEDDGGGMGPDRMRECMSFGYSAKSKTANTIGQYGNGFKTSTMRLGADVIVFSKSPGKDGAGRTECIGLLSFTFLRSTCQEDIIVPMLDYVVGLSGRERLSKTTDEDWKNNLNTIMEWSPYSTEQLLLNQFGGMKEQGTKIIVYNLWEDDQGQFELDFERDPYDIQVRGSNRDENKIAMAERYPNSKHFLTYHHSLRSYASILYLRLPRGFEMILRGKVIEHHHIADDLMHKQEITYRPQGAPEHVQSANMMAIVTIGFVKDAEHHIDVQGFNVYHKNRLIKPFWRIWNSASSQGRGIIGVLEANFVEPAHDKQGFERTTVLSRLESRLIQMQKTYWGKHCHLIGYVNQETKKQKATTAQPTLSSPVHNIQPHPTPELQDKKALMPTKNLPLGSGERLRQEASATLKQWLPERRPAGLDRTLSTTQESNSSVSAANALENDVTKSSSPPNVDGSSDGHACQSALIVKDTTPETFKPIQQFFMHDNPDKACQEDRIISGRESRRKTEKANELAVRTSAMNRATGASVNSIVPVTEKTLTPVFGNGHVPATVGVTLPNGHNTVAFINSVDIGQLEQYQHEKDRLEERLHNLEQSMVCVKERNVDLESKTLDLEQQISKLQENVDNLTEERDNLLLQRDNLSETLEEERKQRELDDQEIRKRLKVALLRVKELEAERTRMQVRN